MCIQTSECLLARRRHGRPPARWIERGSLLIPAILWRHFVVDVAKGDGRGKTPDLSPSGFLKWRNFTRKHLRRHGKKHVVPAADLPYFDATHFALGENAEEIADAMLQ